MSDSNAKVEKLQKLEQGIQGIIMQKQTFQTQLSELENALGEVNKSKENPFKVIGGIMVEANKEDVQKDLNSKKDMAELRVKSLEKQEVKAADEIKTLQSEVVKILKKGN
jgi:prefoldin beta subunit